MYMINDHCTLNSINRCLNLSLNTPLWQPIKTGGKLLNDLLIIHSLSFDIASGGTRGVQVAMYIKLVSFAGLNFP